jgi:CBS domain containing-hemolysin-like protein
MNLVVILLSLLAIVLLTAGTALFVAAEFSLTTLERSTVDANARNGRRRDRFVRRAHHTLSFQLSGAQLGISITTLITGYLTEPLVAELPHPAMDALGVPDRVANAVIAFMTLLVVTSLSMIFGELVPKNLAVARPLQTARAVAGLQLLFSWLTGFCASSGSSPLKNCGRLVRRRNWCRWCVIRLAAARWTPPPRRCCTGRCNSAT